MLTGLSRNGRERSWLVSLRLRLFTKLSARKHAWHRQGAAEPSSIVVQQTDRWDGKSYIDKTNHVQRSAWGIGQGTLAPCVCISVCRLGFENLDASSVLRAHTDLCVLRQSLRSSDKEATEATMSSRKRKQNEVAVSHPIA